jgi:hypothetical protein
LPAAAAVRNLEPAAQNRRYIGPLEGVVWPILISVDATNRVSAPTGRREPGRHGRHRGESGVYVALATGGGTFGAPAFKLAAFAPSAGGWNSNDRDPRELADLNNDGMADIVGFGEDGVYVALATGGGNFATPSFTLRAFAPTAGGWNSDNLYPRQVADINHDGLADIVGFGQSGVYEALNGFHLT